MECTLATLIACFSWAGLYIDTGVTINDIGPVKREAYHTALLDDQGFMIAATSEYRVNSKARNPYGRAALGFELDFESVQWRLEFSHLSSMDTGKDRGVNSINLNARWYPFKRR